MEDVEVVVRCIPRVGADTLSNTNKPSVAALIRAQG